jgi:hypothetical protein
MTWGSDVDALRKVQPGMPLQLPAKTYNAFVDAARDHQQREMSTAANPLRDKDQANIVLVKNESGADRARFDILGVTGPIISRADNVATFQDRIALRGVTPTSAHAGRFVVLVDAIPNGTIGRAYVSGACLARVRMLDEAHTLADVDDGSAAQLVSGETGAASLVWVEPIGERADPTIAWTLIRFGGGGGGGSVTIEGQLILALLNSVQRFSDQQTELPAYHWKEAQLDANGAAVEIPGGEGSKTVPNCESIVVSSEDPSYSVLADPAVDANLTDAAIDSSSGDPLLSFRITGTEDTTHTVTSYQIQVGTGTSPGSRAAYGDSGDLAPGAPPTFAVSGIPLASDVYIRVITKFVQSPTLNHNIYICQFGLNGELAPTIAVVEKLINDPSGAMLITPASGDYAETIDAGVTDLPVTWNDVATATTYWLTVGSAYDPSGNAPGASDIYDSGDLGDVNADTATDVPADGTTVYLYLWWYIPSTWYLNIWSVTISPAPDRRAVNIEDINTLAEGGTISPTPPVDETPLSDPILVEILPTKDTAGNDRYVFVRGGGEVSSAALAYATIESSIGTSPPFVYTARNVAPLGNGTFDAPAGNDFDLYNLSEIGAGGTGVHAVANGSIVAYWQDAATGDRFFDRSFYRGTF